MNLFLNKSGGDTQFVSSFLSKASSSSKAVSSTSPSSPAAPPSVPPQLARSGNPFNLLKPNNSKANLHSIAESSLLSNPSPSLALDHLPKKAIDNIEEVERKSDRDVDSEHPNLDPQQERKQSRYLDLLAREGWYYFRQCTADVGVDKKAALDRTAKRSANVYNGLTLEDDEEEGEYGKAPPPEMRRLCETPSMVMLTEAAQVLSESPSALIPMEAESTGGVYQLRRQKSFYMVPEDINSSPSASGLEKPIVFRGRPRFFNSKKDNNKVVEKDTEKEEANANKWKGNALTTKADTLSRRSKSFSGMKSSEDDMRLRAFQSIQEEEEHSTASTTTTVTSVTTSSSQSAEPSLTLMDASSRISSSHPGLPTPFFVLSNHESSSTSSSTTSTTSASAVSSGATRLRKMATLPSGLYHRSSSSLSPTEATTATKVRWRDHSLGVRNGSEKSLNSCESDSGTSTESLIMEVDVEPKKPAKTVRKYASKLAVFKPEDEETGAKAALRIGQRNPERAGLVVGGGAKRERAAYLLDKNIGRFSGVPETALVWSKLPQQQQQQQQQQQDNLPVYQRKRGSLQRYCESDGSAEDRPDLVRQASARQVHGIGLLDLRMMQTDRHSGNILCRKENDRVKLIPIDHGLTLPDWHFLAEAYFDWHYWAQADTHFDAETLQVIESIDLEKDADCLRDLGFPEGCVATNTLCTLALKVGASYGLRLKDFGAMFQRPFVAGHSLHNKYFSPLEHMVIEACRRCEYEYHPSGTPASTAFFGSLPEPDDFFSDEGNVDIDELEKMAYGNIPPPQGFFKAFEQVLHEFCSSGSWREFLNFTS